MTADGSFVLLIDPPSPGAWNMAVDEALLEAAEAEGQCTFRFYQWQEPTLSLGYFQTYADRWQHEASRQSAVVRRASGGGAIMHDLELTYSVAVPMNHSLAVNRLGFYKAMHLALIDALAGWGVSASLFEEKPGRPADAAPPFLCFQRRASGDVVVGKTKICGSAQRRSKGAVLQHGSVLLARSTAAPELDGLAELVDKEIKAHALIEAWLAMLQRAMPLIWQNGGLSDGQIRRATALATQKYAASDWIEHRGRPGNL